MWKELFGASLLTQLPIFVMVFFMAVFVAVLIRICSRSRSSHYRNMAELPLDLHGDKEEVQA